MKRLPLNQQLARLGLCAWIGFCSLTAAAQPVYRCGADGRSYSHQPCADGRGHVLAIEDAPSAEARETARRVTEREARAADRLERDRLIASAGPRSAAAGLTAVRATEKPERGPAAQGPQARRLKAKGASGRHPTRERADASRFDAVAMPPSRAQRRGRG